MKKYILVFRQSFSQFTAYRLDILLQIFQSFITPAVVVAALLFTSPVSDLRVSGLIPYYIIISLVYPLIRSGIDEEMYDLTYTGEISAFLIKPFSLFNWLYSKNISEKLVILLSLSPVLGLVLLANHISPTGLVMLAVSLVVAFTLSFVLSYFVGLFCFWIEDFWAVHNVKHVAIQLLGGIVLPYSFFPDRVSAFLHYSPFPYLASWPTLVIQGRSGIVDLAIASVWVVIIYISISQLQRWAILKYSYTSS